MKDILTKSQKSSQSRSRSKSKMEKLAERRREAQEFKHEGIIGQMKRFEIQHGRSSPSSKVIQDLIKTPQTLSPKRSQNRKLTHSHSADDIPPVTPQPQQDNLGAIKLVDYSKRYKKQVRIARADSFDDINDREVYKPRHQLEAERKARQQRQQQF